ncbi:hypothetical protein ONZ45_g10107 [Pleurotus djamor]|nr:hypothetical protein ONZ45_g10107 [Pleurotus djamor]
MRASTFLTALIVASSSAYTTFAVPVADAQRFSGATGNALGGNARPANDPDFHPLLRMNSGNGGIGGTTGSGNIGGGSGNREDGGDGSSTGASGATGDVNGGNAEGAAGLLELGSGNGGRGGGAKSGDVGGTPRNTWNIKDSELAESRRRY